MRVTLSIVTEDPVARAGLEAIVNQDDETSLVGESPDETEEVDTVANAESRPHVIILGEPPSKRAIREQAHRIINRYRDEKSQPNILVVSQNDDDDVIIAAVRAGVKGYLTQLESCDELLHSIQVVARGGAVFSSVVAARLDRYFSAVHASPELTGFSDLTSRELQILELVAGGLGNQQIARRLFLAEKTVRNYVSRIFAKLDVHDRTMAAMRARDAGLGGDGVPAA